MNNSFKKAERLNSKKDIGLLYKAGKSLFSHPYRIIWIEKEITEPNFTPVQVLISVSKRNFKKAVDRNQIKRYIREAFRTQKSIIITAQATKSTQLQFGIMYIGKETGDFSFHQKAIEKLLFKLAKEINNK